MKNNKLYAFLLLLCLGALTSCFEEPDFFNVWDGLEVEFDASTLPSNGPQANFVRTTATQTDAYSVQVNLVGAPQATDITVNVAVAPESTAVPGVHFELPSNSVVIPAGTNIVNLPMTVLTGNIEPTETPNLILNITSTSLGVVSANYSTVTVRIRVICPSALAGSYSALHEVVRIGDGSGGASQTIENRNFGNVVTLTAAGTGSYTVDDMSWGLYPVGYGDAAPSGRISDNCNRITGASSNVDQW